MAALADILSSWRFRFPRDAPPLGIAALQFLTAICTPRTIKSTGRACGTIGYSLCHLDAPFIESPPFAFLLVRTFIFPPICALLPADLSSFRPLACTFSFPVFSASLRCNNVSLAASDANLELFILTAGLVTNNSSQLLNTTRLDVVNAVRLLLAGVTVSVPHNVFLLILLLFSSCRLPASLSRNGSSPLALLDAPMLRSSSSPG